MDVLWILLLAQIKNKKTKYKNFIVIIEDLCLKIICLLVRVCDLSWGSIEFIEEFFENV